MVLRHSDFAFHTISLQKSDQSSMQSGYRGNSEQLMPSIQNTKSPNLLTLWRPLLNRFPLIWYTLCLWSGACLLSSSLSWFRWFYLRGIRPINDVFHWYVCRAWFTLMTGWLEYLYAHIVSGTISSLMLAIVRKFTSPPILSALVHCQMLRTFNCVRPQLFAGCAWCTATDNHNWLFSHPRAAFESHGHKLSNNVITGKKTPLRHSTSPHACWWIGLE